MNDQSEQPRPASQTEAPQPGPTSDEVQSPPARASWGSYLLNALRGGLMGTAETVPGVSGGTIALMVGVYETVLKSAGHLLSGVRMGVTDVIRRRGTARAAEQLRQVAWAVVIPLLVGMAVALVVMSSLMEGWVEEYPVQMRALFFGLVLASLWVPYSLASSASRRSGDVEPSQVGWKPLDYAIAVVAAVAAFVIVSLPAGEVEPAPLVIVLSAAVAVSALVLPGLSGSFILLTIGLYQTTLGAVNDRDLGYLGWFALGAVLGLASVVKALQWLLENRRRVTLVVLTGIMAGSLRALWPWQDDDRALQAPGDDLWTAVAFGVGGSSSSWRSCSSSTASSGDARRRRHRSAREVPRRVHVASTQRPRRGVRPSGAALVALGVS
ncbi:DUF368 domain-containing protein [Paraoerskovia sediminicola]|uniref:DUF368 domain-containing protein n=1 Tax=Paraoerskovia sediminicola TaxID=1138587 RepID=UPI0025729EF4|nr:DUF368 domain-containing protein [Paraoerskovia sediminicola]